MTTTEEKPRGLIQIFEDILEALRELAREQYATRQVLRYWIQELAEKEAVVVEQSPSPPPPLAAPSSSEAVKEYYKKREKEKES